MVTHEPYFYEAKDTHTIIIFIHGFMGSPNQFKPMIAAAESFGYSASAVLLPGHGGSISEFNKSNLKAWKTSVWEHIALMRERYANIVLVGHSIGSLLAFSSYGFYAQAIKGIVAIAAPLSISIKSRSVKTSWAVALGKDKEDDEWTKAAHESCSVQRAPGLVYFRSIPRFLDVFKLIFSTKRKLEAVDIPALLIHSVDDEVASIRSMKALEKKLKRVQTLKLYNSGHFYYTKQDESIMIEKFKQFLSELKLG